MQNCFDSFGFIFFFTDFSYLPWVPTYCLVFRESFFGKFAFNDLSGFTIDLSKEMLNDLERFSCELSNVFFLHLSSPLRFLVSMGVVLPSTPSEGDSADHPDADQVTAIVVTDDPLELKPDLETLGVKHDPHDLLATSTATGIAINVDSDHDVLCSRCLDHYSLVFFFLLKFNHYIINCLLTNSVCLSTFTLKIGCDVVRGCGFARGQMLGVGRALSSNAAHVKRSF